MAADVEDRVGNFAFYSRILVILTQVFFNQLMPDHDAKVFNPPQWHTKNCIDNVVDFLLEGFRRWDGVYFIHIAEYGYTYENTLAFFPGFPLIVSVLTNSLFYPLQYIMNYRSVLLISSTVINLWLFTKTARIIFHLGKKVLNDETLAFKSAQLFCINPASIFFSACYSEGLFAFVTFSGMLHLETGQNTLAAVHFGISGFIRSNGMINMGFILYRKFQDCIDSVISSRHGNHSSKFLHSFSTLWLPALHILFNIILCILPFTLYQFFCYWTFCNHQASSADLTPGILNYGSAQSYKMPHSGLSPWCHYAIPLSYSYIQKYHWNVGFLNYYEWKQVPNFLLALPMILLCLGVTIYHARKNWVHFFCLGLTPEMFYKKYDEDLQNEEDYGITSKRCFVYVIHVAFLATFGVLFMHVQVLTRFISSSSPMVFWYVATLTTPKEQLRPVIQSRQDMFRHNERNVYNQNESNFPNGDKASTSITEDVMDWDSKGFVNKVLFAYFHLYFFVGIGAFSNFLPWT